MSRPKSNRLHGFDLTSFGDGQHGADVFRTILKKLHLPERALRMKRQAHELNDPITNQPFVFKNADIKIVVGNNPLTGAYCRKGQRENELGYASYIGIEGDPIYVHEAARLIRELAEFIKEEVKGERQFI